MEVVFLLPVIAALFGLLMKSRPTSQSQRRTV